MGKPARGVVALSRRRERAKGPNVDWQDLISGSAVIDRGGQGNPRVTDVTHDSRQVKPGAVYVAIPGLRVHGDAFITEAVGRGAAAVVSENAQRGCGAPWIQVRAPRKLLGTLAAKLWNVRWEDMVSVGITGTNGKTTIAHLFHHLFSETYGAERSWMFGTISYAMGASSREARCTTPESADIFRFMGLSQPGPRALTMEVSSHALALDRIEGFFYDVALFTNLSQDHLDFHKNMEDYYAAKKRLFTGHMRKDGVAVINIDDPWGARLARELKGIRQITYGRNGNATVHIADCTCSWKGTKVKINNQGETVSFQSNLSGFFNVYNLVAFWAGARALGRSDEEIRNCVKTASPVRGRMERVSIPADYTLVVDYAHTPDALEKVLSAARPLTKGRLLCVFGCGGDRDKTKRPRMAEAVAGNCDEAVVTSDNPRSEDPESIIRDILEGMPLDFPHQVVVDRREAIRTAMQTARTGDCIVVAGKGHETYQEVQGVRHHFDDVEVVNGLQAEMNKAKVNA
ncbi:MAG: UDP-N-acetylmuramoyl-L-alanyl-D-glutamate--2,6-diaminopimelate ligase [Chitinivibrionales bacterium]|nr:UDP-N-acetylmuramoyl-L-alanyl-D-glutamate--2,6-diaminopimelate ligase [Chitinivibrionales bacterium]MBD3394820.1 UDP-N-acetylmuramoyl-L-alanyl-D-glutamate--2,6-diaminopimelate ligase [Chitinivibrionales bacterium]